MSSHESSPSIQSPLHESLPAIQREPLGAVETEPSVPEKTVQPKHASRLHNRLQAAKRSLQWGTVMMEANHAINEPLRLAVLSGTLAETHSAIAGGAALGASTLLIEGAAGLVTSELLSSDNPSRLLEWANKKLKKVIKPGTKVHPLVEASTAVSLGTPAVLELKTLADPSRTLQQNRRRGLFTATWLAAAAGAAGAEFSGQIEQYVDPQKITLGAIAVGGLGLAIQYAKKIVRQESEQKKQTVPSVKLLQAPEEIDQALALEQAVWDEKRYDGLEEYAKYQPQARVFAAFEGDQIVGVTRLFAGSPELPPFIVNMPIEDENLKEELVADCTANTIEELGTIAVAPSARHQKVFMELCKEAFNDAEKRGVSKWGIIMEPRRVQIMNRRLGFTFKQLGPVIKYQGGLCAAHVMDFKEVHENMRSTKPELYRWFIDEPL